MYTVEQGRTQGGWGWLTTHPIRFMGGSTPLSLLNPSLLPPPLLATNETKIPYPKPLKHFNNT